MMGIALVAAWAFICFVAGIFFRIGWEIGGEAKK